MWLRVDDNLPDHPKFATLDPFATCLWLYGLCYAGRFLTDGRIPKAIAVQLATRVTAQQTLLGESELVHRLVKAGLWIVSDNGYRIHDFLHHNPTRRKVLAERKAARVRRRKARGKRVSAFSASPERRPTSQESSGVNDPARPGPVRRSSSSPVVLLQEQGFQVLPVRLKQWGPAYPAVNVAAEIAAAHVWALANPAQHKRNWERFLVNWLKRAQDQAATHPRRETIAERQQRYLHALNERLGEERTS